MAADQPSKAGVPASQARRAPERVGAREQQDVSALQSFAYAAPVTGSWFFYIPMWSILPGVYGKHFGLPLTALAAAILFIRLFDGFIDISVGYLADRHRAAGGSRKPWVAVGGIGAVVACYFLFIPPQPATLSHYLIWSFAFFLAFTITEIPHLTWGSELTLDYHQRAKVYGMRNVMAKSGMAAFYALPLLPMYAVNDYTPEVLRDAVFIGGALTLLGVVFALPKAPTGVPGHFLRGDSLKLLFQSLAHNKPLLLYLCTFACVGLYVGMYYALLYFYMDNYLRMGDKVAMMLLVATIIATASTPLWLRMIRRTSKTAAWSLGVTLFGLQSLGTLLIGPESSPWIAFAWVLLANLSFTCNDIAALSILGDIIDYGKWKFNKDRGTTYFGFNILLFKISLGVGGGIALAIAGSFGFDPTHSVNDPAAVWGLKLGFIVIPLGFLLLCLFLITRLPLSPHRHRIIQRRLESRLLRGATLP